MIIKKAERRRREASHTCDLTYVSGTNPPLTFLDF